MMTTLDLQRALNARGCIPPLDEDGDFGRLTIGAVKRFQRSIGLRDSGVVGPLTLAALAKTPIHAASPSAPVPPVVEGEIVPPWIETARRKMGLSETRGNAELRAFLKSDGNTLGDPARLPWCGDFVETCIALTLPDEPMVANPYYALNWLKFGVELPINKPALGAIGVIKRDGGGHVFFVVGHDRDYWHSLGGNQGNSVSIVRVAKSRTAGLRWPKTVPAPTRVLAETTFDGTISTNEA